MTHRPTVALIRALAAQVLCACLVLGCAAGSGFPGSASTRVENAETASGRSRLVARDLVNALAQVRELDPVTSTIDMATPENRYGSILASELRRAGYDLVKGSSPGGSDFLAYTIKSIAHIDGPAYEFGLSVGDIKLRRQYRLVGNAIKPASSLFVFGTVPTGIVVDDSIFDEPQKSARLPGDASGAETGEQKEWVVQSARDVSAQDELARPLELQNMFEIRESNYSALLNDYDDVRDVILIFGNDSITLGARNKRLTRELVSQYNEDTDLLSVIGCSHGNTAVQGKNRTLALGRSSRVREELILSGVNPGHVLDEGCWDSRHFDEKMPRRGVVLTLKRRQAQ